MNHAIEWISVEANISIGSNMHGSYGSPFHMVQKAINALSRNGLSVLRASSIVRTQPWGRTKQPPFFNAVVLVGCVREQLRHPQRLFQHLQNMEKSFGRHRSHGIWGPRVLDLDILSMKGLSVAYQCFYGRWQRHTMKKHPIYAPVGAMTWRKSLCIPHRFLHARPFLEDLLEENLLAESKKARRIVYNRYC